jgi:hypothetical protein
MSEIQLHIVINVVSCLNATEGFRSLSVEEVSLHEFLLNQILLLQESLESSLVPHVVEELLGREVVAPPLPQSRTSHVLWLWGARWWRSVQWSFAHLVLRR